MEIKIIECCGVHGEIVSKGDIIDVDDPTGRMLIGSGKAMDYTPVDESATKPVIQTQDPAATHHDPAPATPDAKPGFLSKRMGKK